MISFQNIALVTSAPSSKFWPDSDLPEIVLAGRSNVGKSSFINTMCNRKKLAYIGNSPGKTRLLNFFNLDDRFMFVDVPGYGYARLSKQQMLAFGDMMEEYFAKRVQKKGLVLLVDARHKPSEDDHVMMEFVRYHAIPLCVVATKMDKVKPNQKKSSLQLIKDTLCLGPDEKLFAFSAVEKTGINEVWEYLIPLFES